MKAFIAALSVLLLAGIAEAKWVLVVDGVVREAYVTKPDFHPDIMSAILDAPDNVTQGWRKQGNSWLPPKTQADIENDAFDAVRVSVKRESRSAAFRAMTSSFRYKLTGNLDVGYPDKNQPLFPLVSGEALTYDEFSDYIQERDDAGATPQELNQLKQAAKDARAYLRSLKGP